MSKSGKIWNDPDYPEPADIPSEELGQYMEDMEGHIVELQNGIVEAGLIHQGVVEEVRVEEMRHDLSCSRHYLWNLYNEYFTRNAR